MLVCLRILTYSYWWLLINFLKLNNYSQLSYPANIKFSTNDNMSNRLSYVQLEALVEFLEQNPGIAKGLLRTTQGKLETKRKWENLATTLNSLGGAIKDGQGWAKYWAEKKCALKKLCAEQSASMRRTGGGTADNLPTLSALDNRLVAVMGGQEFATGDSGVAVNPFPQQTRQTESPVPPMLVASELVVEDTEMDSIQNISPIPGTSHSDAVPASSTIPAPPSPLQSATRPRPRRRSSLIPRPVNEMERFTNIENRRVEAEMMTAQSLSRLSEQFSNIANALTSISNSLTSIANAISDVARKMPNP